MKFSGQGEERGNYLHPGGDAFIDVCMIVSRIMQKLL